MRCVCRGESSAVTSSKGLVRNDRLSPFVAAKREGPAKWMRKKKKTNCLQKSEKGKDAGTRNLPEKIWEWKGGWPNGGRANRDAEGRARPRHFPKRIPPTIPKSEEIRDRPYFSARICRECEEAPSAHKNPVRQPTSQSGKLSGRTRLWSDPMPQLRAQGPYGFPIVPASFFARPIMPLIVLSEG